jgi:hypothetical protein
MTGASVVIVPFSVEHLRAIRLQAAQAGVLETVGDVEAAYIEASDYAFTAMDGDDVVACAGILKLWEGRGHAWALLSGSIGHRFVRVHRAVKRAIEISGYRRIEMDVDASHAEAIKWAGMLGFYNETPDGMRGYTTDGRLYYRFARVE